MCQAVRVREQGCAPKCTLARKRFHTFSLQQDTLVGRADSLTVYQMSETEPILEVKVGCAWECINCSCESVRERKAET